MAGIQIRRNNTPGTVPANLQEGELAINTADGKLYAKVADQIAVIGAVSFIDDAPADFGFYTRRNHEWVDVSPYLIGAPPAPLKTTLTAGSYSNFMRGFANNIYSLGPSGVSTGTSFGTLQDVQFAGLQVLSIANRYGSGAVAYRCASIIIEGAPDKLLFSTLKIGTYTFQPTDATFSQDTVNNRSVWYWGTATSSSEDIIFPTDGADYSIEVMP